MKKFVIVALLVIFMCSLHSPKIHAQSNRDLILVELLCAINNAQEVTIWAALLQQESPNEFGAALQDYGLNVIADVHRATADLTEQHRRLIKQHGQVWYFYGYALQHPEYIATAIELYQFHRQEIYKFMAPLEPVICDMVWDRQIINTPDPRNGTLLGLPTKNDWFSEIDFNKPT